jgi:hypothetical protein
MVRGGRGRVFGKLQWGEGQEIYFLKIDVLRCLKNKGSFFRVSSRD